MNHDNALTQIVSREFDPEKLQVAVKEMLIGDLFSPADDRGGSSLGMCYVVGVSVEEYEFVSSRGHGSCLEKGILPMVCDVRISFYGPNGPGTAIANGYDRIELLRKIRKRS